MSIADGCSYYPRHLYVECIVTEKILTPGRPNRNLLSFQPSNGEARQALPQPHSNKMVADAYRHLVFLSYARLPGGRVRLRQLKPSLPERSTGTLRMYK